MGNSPMDGSPHLHRRFAPWRRGELSIDVLPHVHGAKRLWMNCLWGEMSSVGQITHGAKRPYMGQNVHGAKSLQTFGTGV